MPSDKKPPKLMADCVREAYQRVYGIAHDDPRAQPTYEPFMEGYLACHRDRGPYPPRNAPPSDTLWAIERSAQALESAARGFTEIAPPGDDTASGLADSYEMAANEVRLQIPAYAAMKERNLARIKAWDKASAPPELERWNPESALGVLGTPNQTFRASDADDSPAGRESD